MENDINGLTIKSIASAIATAFVVIGATTDMIVSPEFSWYYAVKGIFIIFSIVLILQTAALLYHLFLVRRDAKKDSE